MIVNLIVLGVFLLIVLYFDAFQHRIPNWLNVTGALAGIIINVLLLGLHGLIQSFSAAIICGVIMFILYLAKALGAGDVKLFFAIGAIAGDILFTLYALMYSVIFAGVIGLIILLVTKTFIGQMLSGLKSVSKTFKEKSMKPMDEFKKKKATTFPFIYAVIPGVIATCYYMFVG